MYLKQRLKMQVPETTSFGYMEGVMCQNIDFPSSHYGSGYFIQPPLKFLFQTPLPLHL